jgi:hypothetical protein
LPLPGDGVAVSGSSALQDDPAEAQAMGLVPQWWGLTLQRLELNPASFECPCRQTVRSGSMQIEHCVFNLHGCFEVEAG